MSIKSMSGKNMSHKAVNAKGLRHHQDTSSQAKPRCRTNLQNVHMLKSQLRVSQTLNTLVRMGLTILEVHLGQTTPVVTIQASAGTKKFAVVVLKKRLQHGRYRSYYSTQLNQCSIQWESQYVH